MYNHVAAVVDEVSQWAGITAEPHRFGGTEFKLGKVEIGHIHRNGMVDIPFTRAIRDQLIAENKAGYHHLLTESGWITFYIRTPADVQNAIWMFKVSYVQKSRRRGVTQDQTLADSLELSAPLRALVLKNVT